jgi:hemolysin activation/secretion protein
VSGVVVDRDQFECSRPGDPSVPGSNARPGFSVVRGDLGYSRRLLGWEFMTKLDFQAGAQALVPGEQIQAGGMDSVRGYLEGEAAGDAGWRLRTEVKTPALLDLGGSSLRAVGFVDGAVLWVNNPTLGEIREFSLAGAGVGLRLKGAKGGPLLAFDLTQALKAGRHTVRGNQRLHMRMGYEF